MATRASVLQSKYARKPQGFKPKLEVCGCLIEWRGKILVLRRNPNKPHGNRWALPSGKKWLTETRRKAVRREVLVETGIPVEPEHSVSYHYPTVSTPYSYHVFKAKLGGKSEPKVMLSQREHTQFKWVAPRELLTGHHLIRHLKHLLQEHYPEQAKPARN